MTSQQQGERPDELPRPGTRSFPDAQSLQRRLDRRTGDRRSSSGRAAPASADERLGTRELCHDLRQPLAAASALVRTLEQEPALSSAGRGRLGLLQNELSRLATMIGVHLEPPDPELVDLARTAADVCAAASAAAGSVELVTTDSPPLVLGEPVLLARMLTNLVTNARGAAGPRGRVRVTAARQVQGACLVVEDSGPTGDDPAPSGYGLGLMIVEAVAGRHRGHVECTASDLGGLKLTVVLPAALPSQDGGQAR